jgi:protein TonB
MKKNKYIFILIISTTCCCFAQNEDSSITKSTIIEVEEKGIEKVKKNDGTVLKKINVMPQPVDGLEGISSRLKYPKIALEQGIEGKVYVLAYVNEFGDVENAQVIKGIGGGCDEEALRVVKETKFIPGMHNGENVKIQISVPIIFRLNKVEE